jgi:hypothetical protein
MSVIKLLEWFYLVFGVIYIGLWGYQLVKKTRTIKLVGMEIARTLFVMAFGLVGLHILSLLMMFSQSMVYAIDANLLDVGYISIAGDDGGASAMTGLAFVIMITMIGLLALVNIVPFKILPLIDEEKKLVLESIRKWNLNKPKWLQRKEPDWAKGIK